MLQRGAKPGPTQRLWKPLVRDGGGRGPPGLWLGAGGCGWVRRGDGQPGVRFLQLCLMQVVAARKHQVAWQLMRVVVSDPYLTFRFVCRYAAL